MTTAPTIQIIRFMVVSPVGIEVRTICVRCCKCVACAADSRPTRYAHQCVVEHKKHVGRLSPIERPTRCTAESAALKAGAWPTTPSALARAEALRTGRDLALGIQDGPQFHAAACAALAARPQGAGWGRAVQRWSFQAFCALPALTAKPGA